MKRKALASGPKKKPTKTRSEVYSTNLKHFGAEPVHNGLPMTMSEKARHLAWYANMCTVEDAREYANEYLQANMPDILEDLQRVADTSFPLTASWLARMSTCGAHTETKTRAFIKKAFEDAVRKYAGRAEEKVDAEIVSAA